MDFEKAKQIHYLLFTFMGLFHQKIILGFREEVNMDSSLKKNHKKILNILYQNDKLTITEIGKLLDIEKGSLTTLIDVLVDNNLVLRLHDPADRRKTLLSLSEDGREEMDRVMNCFSQKINELLKAFDPQETENFKSNLQFVVDIMKKL